jgi:hypothetical protein
VRPAVNEQDYAVRDLRTAEERQMFHTLLMIPRIGIKAARALLQRRTVDQIRRACYAYDPRSLCGSWLSYAKASRILDWFRQRQSLVNPQPTPVKVVPPAPKRAPAPRGVWTRDLIDAYLEDLERPTLRRDRRGRRPSLDYYDNLDPEPYQAKERGAWRVLDSVKDIPRKREVQMNVVPQVAVVDVVPTDLSVQQKSGGRYKCPVVNSRNEVYESILKASRAHSIGASTLWTALNGLRRSTISGISWRYLTDEEFAAWQAAGYPSTLPTSSIHHY